jgi:Na+/glutamate symporter
MNFFTKIRNIGFGQIIAVAIIIYLAKELIFSFSPNYVSSSSLSTFRLLLIDIFVTLITFGVAYLIHRRDLIKENIVAYYVVIFTFIYGLIVAIFLFRNGYSMLGYSFDLISISIIIATILQRLLVMPLQKDGYLILRDYTLAVVGSFFAFMLLFEVFGFLVLIPILGNDVPNHTAAQIMSSFMGIVYYFITSIYLPIVTFKKSDKLNLG